MSRQARPSVSDLQQVLRLCGEARDMPLADHQRERHLLAGLCRLTGARVGMIAFGRPHRPRWRALNLALMSEVGLEPSQRHRMLDYYRAENPSNPLHEGVSLRLQPPRCVSAGTTVTVVRRQVGDDRLWYGHPFVAEFFRRLDLDDHIACFRIVCPFAHYAGLSHAMLLIRAWGDRPFERREAMLAHLLWSESGRLLRPAPANGAATGAADGATTTHANGAAAAPAPADAGLDADVHRIALAVGGLPRRLEEVLRGLLAGHDAAALAAALGLSRHTVYDHMRRLYRRLSITRETELAGRCLHLVRQAG